MHRTDNNQSEIIEGLSKCGFSVLNLSQVGNGCPDLLVVSRKGHNILMEVKTLTGKLRENQEKFKKDWQGQIAVIRSVEQALDILEDW